MEKKERQITTSHSNQQSFKIPELFQIVIKINQLRHLEIRWISALFLHKHTTCADIGVRCVKLARLCVEDSISLSTSSLLERREVPLLVIPAGPME